LSRWAAAHGPTLAGLGLLAVMYGAASLRYSSEHFCTAKVLVNLFEDRAVLGIVGAGLALVIISGGIDLSVGAVMGLSSIVIAKQITAAGWPAWAAIATALGGGAALGALQGAIVQATGLAPFIVTLAGMFLARGIAFLVNLEPIPISDAGHANLAALSWRPADEWPRVHIATMVLVGVVLVGGYLGRSTRFGRTVYAMGGNEESALLMGLPVARTRVLVYALSGFASALAGAVLTLQISSGTHTEGVGMELDAIAAVVIGGALLSGGSGSVLGSLVGTLIVSLILTAITFEGGMTSGLTRVIIGGLLLAFVLLQKLLTRLAAAGAV
jgi:simple sugar transport system permease protein